MKILFKTLLIFFIFSISLVVATSQEEPSPTILQASISVDKVPSGFFGTWRVTSVQSSSTDPFLNTGKSVDYWNLSRVGDVLVLMNPVSSARAQVDLQSVSGNTIKFQKTSKDTNEVSYETPILKLEGENFSGTDTIEIEKYKYGKLIKKDTIEYKLYGEKVSGASMRDLLKKTK